MPSFGGRELDTVPVGELSHDQDGRGCAHRRMLPGDGFLRLARKSRRNLNAARNPRKNAPLLAFANNRHVLAKALPGSWEPQ
ncbi:hypothetical protein AURDEDRAFT_163607 [Auricularia subglabra TFB-10046 SS5]|nr:hypothetical protein AURDEDRAFT_163607 [Auricularia subglabra TFB-10046 SS5]